MLLAAEDEFNALDRAIGDGDHGTNLARAARTLAPLRDELAPLALGEALIRAGRAIVMSVGGASGPLYGTLLMETGKSLHGGAGASEWGEAFAAGVDAVANRGPSQEGDKTMLDVLAPAARAFRAKASKGAPAAVLAMRESAGEGLSASAACAPGATCGFRWRALGRRGRSGAVSAFRCLAAIAAYLGEAKA